jgi:hypothetical protein
MPLREGATALFPKKIETGFGYLSSSTEPMDCCNCGECRRGMSAVLWKGKPFCGMDCLGQYARAEMLPTLNELEERLTDDRQEHTTQIAFLEELAEITKDNPTIIFQSHNSARSTGRADTTDPTVQAMFRKKKNQITGTQLLMVKNLKARNGTAYRIFKEKFQEQYEEYIAITLNSEQRKDESDRAMDWLKLCEIFERFFA